MTIPTDPIILLSFINTQLRDYFSDLDDLCHSLQINRSELEAKLFGIQYQYNEDTNQFV